MTLRVMQEKQIESHNSHLAHSVKNYFPPSWLEVIIYFLGSFVVLTLLNYRILTGNIEASSGLSQSSLNGYLHDKLTSVADFISRLLQGRIASILFWAFLGSLIYMGIWVVQNLVINIENDVRAGEFAGQADKRTYWRSVVSSKVFFFCSLAVLIIYGVVLAGFLLPLASKTYGLAVSTSAFPKNLIGILLSLAAATVLLYLFVLTLRVTVRSWRWIITNF